MSRQSIAYLFWTLECCVLLLLFFAAAEWEERISKEIIGLAGMARTKAVWYVSPFILRLKTLVR